MFLEQKFQQYFLYTSISNRWFLQKRMSFRKNFLSQLYRNPETQGTKEEMKKRFSLKGTLMQT